MGNAFSPTSISATAFGCVGIHHLLTLPPTTLNIVSFIKFLTYHAHAQMMVIYTHFNTSFTAVAYDEETKVYLTFQFHLLYTEPLNIKLTYISVTYVRKGKCCSW